MDSRIPNPSEFYTPVEALPASAKLGPDIGPGWLLVYWFPNGYGASVIQHKHSYGGDIGRWEIAVLHRTVESNKVGTICYLTPVTSDVIGHVEPHEVDGWLHEICDLENNPHCTHNR